MMTNEVQALAAALPRLGESDQRFAASLIGQADKRYLSDKQMAWVRKLTERAANPTPATVEIASLSGVVALMTTAKGNLKSPRWRVRVNGADLYLTVAKERAKAPGTIDVKSAAADATTGERIWYGRIRLNGTFEPSRRLEAAQVAMAVAALTEVAADPAATAKAYATATATCCMCGIGLTDDRSVTAGYGPVCAENWGLPWG